MEEAHFVVLLIEDSPGDARLIQIMLSSTAEPSYRVHHVDRLAAGLDYLANSTPDAVLLDLSLPDSQGLDSFRRLRAQAPALPVVVLSGLDDEIVAVEMVQSGAQDYLIKGQVEPEALTRALRYAIERGRVERERSILLASEQAARAEAEEAVLALNTRVRQQAVVAALGQKALSGLRIESLLDAVVEAVAAALVVEYTTVFEVQPDGETLLLRAGVGWRDGLIGHGRVPLISGSPAGAAVVTGAPVVIDSLADDPRANRAPILFEHNAVSGACVLIQGRERPWGTLGAYATARRTFSADDVNFIQAAANILSAAIERQRAELEADALHEAALAIGAALDLDGRLGRVLDAALGLVDADSALLGVIRREQGEIELLSSRGETSVAPGVRIPIGQGLLGELAATNCALRSSDLRTDAQVLETDFGLLTDARSWLGVPLIDQRESSGLLVVLSRNPNAFGERSTELLTSLAALAAAALREAQLRIESQESEARYHSIFEGVTDAILVADDDGCYIDANRSASDLFGYSHDELVQMRVGDLSMAPRKDTLELFESFQRSGRHAAAGEVRRKDGTVVPVNGRGLRLELQSGPIFVGIVQDLSEQRALEQLRQNFMAMITHDLRNPLTSMKAYAQVMQRRQAYSERAVEMIVSQVDHLNRLLVDLLDVVRSETGQLQLRREATDLARILRVCADQAQTTTQNHVLRLDLPPRPIVGAWDPDRLEQIVRNLLVNSIKYSSSEIVVCATCDDDEVRVSIQDQGEGIAPALLPRLFEQFQRGSATAERSGGLGLGLYITKLLVEAHGGRIWAESVSGSGSTFTFTLPIGSVETDPALELAKEQG